jgi:peptidoglycan/LPS O-acetylase OafA/YrhL
MFLFALCFIVLAIWSKKNWWAIILGGIFASIGFVVVLNNFIPHEEYPSLPNTLKWGVYTWVLLLGLAATFGFVWLRRKTQPTGWAMYPAAGLLAMAVLAFILGSRFNEIWLYSVVLVVGVVFVLAKIIERKLDAVRQISNVKV